MSCLQCYDWVWYFHALTIFSITPKRRKKIASDANSRIQFSAHKFNYSTHLKKVCQVIRSISKFHYRQFFGALVLQKRLIIENRKWGVKSKQNHLPPFFFNQNVWCILWAVVHKLAQLLPVHLSKQKLFKHPNRFAHCTHFMWFKVLGNGLVANWRVYNPFGNAFQCNDDLWVCMLEPLWPMIGSFGWWCGWQIKRTWKRDQ